jgi:hypothetical protein
MLKKDRLWRKQLVDFVLADPHLCKTRRGIYPGGDMDKSQILSAEKYMGDGFHGRGSGHRSGSHLAGSRMTGAGFGSPKSIYYLLARDLRALYRPNPAELLPQDFNRMLREIDNKLGKH